MKPLCRTILAMVSASALTAPALAQNAPSALPGAPVGAQLQRLCDKHCLEGFIDKYLEALVAHDPSRLRLTDDVKFTENTVRLNLGEALWSTATGVGEERIYLSDPYSNQAGFLGVVMEKGKPRLLALRLQIKNGRIKEIETIVTRTGLAGDFKSEMATRKAKPIWDEVLKPSERVSRSEMIRVANLYFEGMEQNTGEIVPFDDSCNRTENGLQTTNNPNLTPPGGGNGGGMDFGKMGCKAQFNGGGVGIFSTPERRFWLVDEDRGIVVGMFIFTIKDTLTAVPIAEAFKIKNGRIYEIEAIGTVPMPYGSRSGW